VIGVVVAGHIWGTKIPKNSSESFIQKVSNNYSEEFY
jgi:hypothetical protein